jgi:hypothetical protein
MIRDAGIAAKYLGLYRIKVRGKHYTVCDPYGLFFYDLGTRIKLPMYELAAYAAVSKRMLERSAVSKVRGLEEDVSKGSSAWNGQY